MINGPLSGIKVIELSTYVAAPSCARLLGDMGAEVIKVESFDGDPWRNRGKNFIKRGDIENPIFDIYNIGKESICINIKEPKGMECLMKMLEDADVFITNTRLKSLKKLGLDGESLLARFPQLIIATIDGFGPVGPDAQSPGFDNVAYWTRSGFLLDMSVETDTSYPISPPTGCGDSVAGNTLATGVVAALYNRQRTGKGDVVSVSLYGTAVWTMGTMIIRAQKKYGEKFPMRREEMNPFSCHFKCADGEWFCITVLDYGRYSGKIYELLGIEDLIARLEVKDYYDMQAHRGEIIRAMEASFLKKPVAEWIRLFGEADIVSSRMNHFRDVTEDEQALVNGYVKTQTFRNGETCILPCPPIRLASCEESGLTEAPLPGEQTEQILQRMGYSEEDIREMYACGAVK